MRNKINIFLIIAAILLAVVLVYAVRVSYTQSEKWLKQTAVQGCLEVGFEEYTNPEGNSKAIIPHKQTYEDCMREKGY